MKESRTRNPQSNYGAQYWHLNKKYIILERVKRQGTFLKIVSVKGTRLFVMNV